MWCAFCSCVCVFVCRNQAEMASVSLSLTALADGKWCQSIHQSCVSPLGMCVCCWGRGLEINRDSCLVMKTQVVEHTEYCTVYYIIFQK